VQSDGTWSTTVTLANGTNILTAQDTDAAGNTGTSSPVVFTLSTTAPTVSESLAFDTGASTTDRITSNDALTGSGLANTVVHFTIDGSLIAATVTANAQGAWSFTPPGLADGVHTIVASQTNTFGNTGTASLTFTLDTTAPVVAITSPGGPTNQTSQTISGTVDVADIGTTVTLFDNGSTTALGTASVGSGGVWSTSVTLSGNGSHSIVAKDTDAAGNTGSSTPVVFTLDTVPPVIDQGPLTVSVTDGGVFYASGHLTVTDPGAVDPLTWSIVGGSRVTSETYQYGIDEFKVVKTIGGTSTTIFDDTFTGTAPPAGPNFILPPTAPNGAYFVSGGTLTSDGGIALMDGSNAAVVGLSLNPANYDAAVFGQYTTLLTGTSFNSNPGVGLRSEQSFSVNGLFNLAIPADSTSRYGIRLSDRVSGTTGGAFVQPGTENVDLTVVHNANGTASVQLNQIDFETGTIINLQTVAINPAAGDNEILLTLSNSASNNGQIQASFTLERNVNGVEVADGPAVSFTTVGHIFSNENWTRPQFYGQSVATPSSSPQADSVLQGTYGTLDLAQNGTWQYFLNPGLASVKALAAGQTAQDVFTVAATDLGGQSTQTITVNVTGINDPPVLTSASLTVSQAGTALVTPANIGVTDPDNTNFTFTVSNVSHGTFQTTTNGVAWVNATTFTTADLAANHVRFADDGSQTTPTFSIQANDGSSLNSLSNVLVGTVVLTAPTLTERLASDTGSSATDKITSNDALTGTGIANTVVHFSVDGTAIAATTTANAQGVWSFTPTIADGAHTIVASQTDGVGNIGTATLSFTLDTDAPTVAISTAGGTTNTASHTISGTAEPADAGTIITILDSVATNSPLTPYAAALLTAGHDLTNGLGGATGFGNQSLAIGDDNSSAAINITSVFGAAGVNFFGHNYTSFYINNNGNITFASPNGTYTPSAISAGANNPIIAPFWADVDTRGGPAGATPGGNSTGANQVIYNLDTVDGVLTITWDDVGYYSSATNKLDAFQVQLISLGGGNFDIVYRYENINWTTGSASGGSNGLGGTPARAGYSAGDGTHYFELPQSLSGNQAALLALPTTAGNTGIPGVDVFQVVNGVVDTPTQTVVGTATVQSDGTWSTTVTLANGTNILTAQDTDAAGNTGTSSPVVFTLNEPVISGAGNTVSYPGTPVLLDQSIAVTDAANTVTSVNASISSGFQNGDQLTINGTADGNIANSDGSTIHYHYDTNSHSISLSVLTGSATLGDFDAAMRLIQFSSTSSDPTAGGTDTSRTVTWTAHDNTNASSPAVTTTVDLSISIATDHFRVTQNTDGTTTVTGLSVSDEDASPTETFTINAVTAGAGSGSSITPSTASGHLSDINAALATGVTYHPGPTPPQTDKIVFTVADSFGGTDSVNFIFNEAGTGQTPTLQGTAGKDVIFATGDQDILIGGGGLDQFVFKPSSGTTDVQHTITDFVAGLDKIDVRQFSNISSLANITETQQGNDTLLTLDSHETLLLKDVITTSLHASDFIISPHVA
jgi:VCBS repeat-containing protein